MLHSFFAKVQNVISVSFAKMQLNFDDMHELFSKICVFNVASVVSGDAVVVVAVPEAVLAAVAVVVEVAVALADLDAVV